MIGASDGMPGFVRSDAMSSCCMSFRDLFQRARGRDWTPEEEEAFQALSQPQRNALVRQLASEAGNIRTEDRTGSDGRCYTAFWAE